MTAILKRRALKKKSWQDQQKSREGGALPAVLFLLVATRMIWRRQIGDNGGVPVIETLAHSPPAWQSGQRFLQIQIPNGLGSEFILEAPHTAIRGQSHHGFSRAQVVVAVCAILIIRQKYSRPATPGHARIRSGNIGFSPMNGALQRSSFKTISGTEVSAFGWFYSINRQEIYRD